jgi:signal transduction histidine kinase
VTAEAASRAPAGDFVGRRVPAVGRPDDAAVSEAYCRAALGGDRCRLLGRVHEAQEGQDRRLAADLLDGHVQALAGIGFKLDPVVETALFRVAQQAMANVVDHAGATHVLVAVERADPAEWRWGA